MGEEIVPSASSPALDGEGASASTSGLTCRRDKVGSTPAEDSPQIASLGLENFELPRSNVVKLAKSEVGDSVQLRKEVQQAMLKVRACVHQLFDRNSTRKGHGKGGKIISAQHVLDAVAGLELGDGAVKELKDTQSIQRKRPAKKVSKKSDKNRRRG